MNKRLLIAFVSIIVSIMAVPIILTIHEYNEQRTAYVYGIPENARFSYRDLPMTECSWCHREKNLNRHHIVPQSADRSLRDEPTNIVVLCRDCHFVLGHKCNWKHFNPDVMTIVNTYTNIVISRVYNEGLNKEETSNE